MPQLLKRLTPKARKHHWCSGCAAYTIPKGFRYQRDTYVFDGRVYDWCLCDPCVDIADHVIDFSNDLGDGVTDEDFFAWSEDARFSSDHTVRQKANAYLIRSGNKEWIHEDV